VQWDSGAMVQIRSTLGLNSYADLIKKFNIL